MGEAAGNIGASGGSDFQLARAQAAGELGRNTERAGTNLRYQDFQNSTDRFMNAMQMGSAMDQAAAGQTLQAEIANRADLTDRQKADLSAQVQRELANQGTRAGILQGNQGVGAGLAQSNQGTQAGLALGNQGTGADLRGLGASLATQRAIANQQNSLGRDSLTARSNADYLNAMLGAAGLENDMTLGRLGAMGSFAGGQGALEQAGAGGMVGAGTSLGALEEAGAGGINQAAGGLGALEQGSLAQIPALEGIGMDRLNQAGQLQNQVDARNAAASSAYNNAMNQWNNNALNWDFNAGNTALNDLINQNRTIGGHIQSPTGLNPGGGSGGAGAGGRPPMERFRNQMDR